MKANVFFYKLLRRQPLKILGTQLLMGSSLFFVTLIGMDSVFAEREMAPKGAKVYFKNIKNGDELISPLDIQFGTDGMVVAPAGQKKAHSGHHHLLVDSDVPDLSMPIPKDEHHIHFGNGQTELKGLKLSEGEHTLQLLMGDYQHIPHKPPVISDKITVKIVKPKK